MAPREPAPQHALTAQDCLLLPVSLIWDLTPWGAPRGSELRSSCLSPQDSVPEECANERRQKEEHSSEEDALVRANLRDLVLRVNVVPSFPLFCASLLCGAQAKQQG